MLLLVVKEIMFEMNECDGFDFMSLNQSQTSFRQ